MKYFLTAWLLLICCSAYAYQSTITVPNGTGAQVRQGMNNALQAVTTHQSSSTAPNPTYPFQIWADTTSAPNGTVIKIRNSQNTAWIVLCTANDSTGTLSFPGSIANATNSAQLGGQVPSYYQPASSAVTASNISTQSVSYAASAGKASPMRLDGVKMNFNYAGTAGQPTWMFGDSGDGVNWSVYNPSNFYVNRAVSADAAPWNGISGKPTIITGIASNRIVYVLADSGLGWAYSGAYPFGLETVGDGTIRQIEYRVYNQPVTAGE